MLCTAPAASGHFYQLTERNSEMRETSLANFDIKRPSAGNATNITEQWWSQWRRWRSVLSDSCTYCRSRTPNICAENKFMFVSEGSCTRITWLSDERWNCKSFEYKTSFCRPPPPTPLPFNSPAQIELASKRSSYATVDVTAPWARTRHLSVQMHFCPLKLLCATWINFCATTEVVFLIRMSATEDGTAKMEMKKKSSKRSLRKNAPVKSNSYQWSERNSAWSSVIHFHKVVILFRLRTTM